MLPLLLSAVLALTAVAVADRVEQRLVAPAAPAATGVEAPSADAPSAPVDTSPSGQTPRTSAALPSGEMVLTFADGSASISTGANEPIFELGTITIGDVDLSGVEPVIARGDAGLSADWGAVTEWYRSAGDGIEHGYTVDEPVSAGDDLAVTVDVVAGEPTLVDGQTVAIERTDGSTVWYRGLFAFDANGTDLPAEMVVVDGDIELRVDTAGAEYPITIDPTISEQQELLASTPEALEYFGSVGAIDEARGRMIVGGGETATIFELEEGVWTRVQELQPGVVASVDISGDIAVIGSIAAGTVEIYDRSAGGIWQLSQTLASGDAGFGAAVGVGDGANVDFIMTGAPEEPWTGSPDPGPNGGRLRGYTRTVAGFFDSFNGLGTSVDTFQGAAVDVEHLGGDDFSYGWTLTGGVNWVIVRTISWNGSSFVQTDQRVARYSDAGLAPGSGFGGDLDIEGTGFVVAADAASGAFVYDFDGPVARVGSVGTELFPTASLVPSSGTGLLSVARGTETIAIGASTAAGGAVELFDFSPTSETWSTTGEPFQPAGYTPVAGGEYGKFVALSGRVLATGDPLADGAFPDQGRAFTADLAPLPGFLIVTDAGDDPDADAGDGVCDTGGEACTLRAAIQEANARPGTDTIVFDIPGAGPHTIAPASPLPPVTDTVVIDGYTQPGAQANTAPTVTTDAVVPVRLLGPGVGSGVVGLDLSGSTDSVVRGLTIAQFATAISAGERSVIAGNFIGTDGVDVLGNIDGVLVDGVDGVAIGGIEFADRNLISGNGGGISIIGDADDNVILNNLIGADASGTVPLGNGSGIIMRARDGADISTRDGNQIGTGFLSGRNTIAGNNGEGISIGAGSVGTQVIGNWIGVGFGVAGATLGNNQSGPDTGTSNWGGVVVRGGAGTTIGGLGSEGNLIANNNNGVVILSGDGNRIVGNTIRDNIDRGIVISGVGVNDPGDSDEGANRGQNHPLLTSAAIDGGNLVIDYSIDTVDIEAYPIIIEFFEADSGASGEGERFIRRETVTGPGAGTSEFLVGTIVDGDPIVATATDAAGNTSTFSNVAVVGGSDALVSSNADERFGQSIDLDGNRMAVGAPSADLGAVNAGAVYVYDRISEGSPWVLTATIPSPAPEANGRFGDSLDIRGDRIAIGESDRLSPFGEDEGRVWVFERGADGVWSQLGGWIEAEGFGEGNQFGASIAWIDDDRLAIGAPGAPGSTGEVWVAEFRGGEIGWIAFELSTTNSSFPQSLDDQLGFSVAFDDSPTGDGRLVAGAPGASRRYEWTIGAGPIGNPGVAQFAEAWNMGSAVDISGDRIVTAGISDRLRVNVNESSPIQRSNTTDLGPVVPASTLNAAVNDYLAIEGSNVAVGRGGAGGRVEIYTINDLLTLEASTTFAPSVTSGDLLGWAIELQGRTLVAGAPGTNAGAGAVFSTSVTLEPPPDEPIVVDSLLDTVADDGLCTLREAITAANSDTAANGCIAGSGADTINFAVSGAIVLDTRLPIITSDIEIDGTDADITLDGRGGSGTAILRINSGTVALSNLLVFRGNEQSCPNLPTDPDNSTFCGAVLNYGTLNISQVTFDRNQANNGAGAAIANRGATSILTVDRSTFTNQSTPFTGGISNWGDAVVSNSTFVDNGRAAIENRTGATMDVVNSTFTGSGVGLNNSGTLTLRNSIVNGAVGLTCEGTIIADGFNLDTDGTCGGATTVTLAELDLDPLADNGGPTQTVGLGAASVAIDAADDTVCSAAPIDGIDQRGLGRPFGPSCDIGAFEVVLPTFVNTTVGASWSDPANWSVGVPGPGDTAVVPAGTFPTIAAGTTAAIGRLVLGGELAIDGTVGSLGELTIDSATIEPGGILRVRAGGLMTVDGEIDVQGGGQVVNFESTPDGVIRLRSGASIVGDGLVANSGLIETDGAVTIGSGLTWNSGRNSVIAVGSGTLDVQDPDFDAQGGLTVSPGGRIDFVGNTILRPSSNLVFGVASDGSAGIISTQQLGFEVFGAGDPDSTLARIELDLVDGSAPVGPITIFECTDCAADPPGLANGVEFDEFVTGDYDVIVGRNTVDVAILDNKNRSAAGGAGFGSSVSVDGDRAVVGSFDGITGPAVLERVGEAWQVVQALSNSSSVNVTLDGDQFIADGVLYEFDAELFEFDATNVIGGTSFDFDGDLALLGDDGLTAQVFLRTDFATALAVLEPGTVPASYGVDVALLDLGGGSAIAAVSAPDVGRVYVFEQVGGIWSSAEVRVLASPDGDGNRFGQSISISGSALVVGEPLNDSPRGDGGAAWVYPLEGTSVADTPVKLTPSRIDGGDQFGSDVSIDGDVLVVGAAAAQKFGFPLRDGAAFVFQFDGIDWVETDELRAADAFSFELFGDAVAVSGTDVLVGARRDRNSNGFEAGAVYDFEITPIEPVINTFIGAVDSSWADPANWSSGSVPVIDEPAIVPAGAIAEIPAGAYFVGALTLGGRLQMASGGTDTTFLLGAGSVIEPSGVLAFSGSFTCFDATDPACPSDNRLTIGGDLVIDGLLDVSVTTTGNATVFSKSIPQVVLADDTSVIGDGSLFLAVPLTKSGSGTSTFGPDLDVELFGEPPRPAEDRGVLQIDEGTLDIQSAAPNGSFQPNGTIEVAPGATVSVAGDLSLSATSALSFGVDGPSASTDNYGQLVLPTGTLVADGTLRITTDGYTPVFDDAYTLISCAGGSCISDPVTDFAALDVLPLTVSRTTGSVLARGPELPVGLSFDFQRTSDETVRVGDGPIEITQVTRATAAPTATSDGTVAASSVTLVADDDNAVAGLLLSDTEIGEIILDSPELRAIPLASVRIDVEGGWSEVVRGVAELEREPITSLTLGQVLDAGLLTDETTPAGRVGALPLGAIDVEGTPLGAIPLGAIALGSTPLGAIPLGAISTDPNPWCVALEGLFREGETCESALLDLTVTEVALRGAPLGAIPLGAIPLGAIDLQASPLGAIPLGAIDLAASPLGAIPLGAIPLGAIGLEASPLGAIPLGAIPLGAIPLGAIDLVDTPLGAIPLGAIELGSDVLDTPTSLVVDAPTSGRVTGAPLGAIPLGAILLADVPLGAIPLEENGSTVDWCAVLADIAPEFSCDQEVLDGTTIAELSLQGVPLGAIPLGAIPLGAIPLGAIDLGATPLGAIPLGAIPLGAIPLGAIDLSEIGLGATPLGAIPLGAIPLGAIDIAGSPLGAIPLGAIPLGAIPLGAIPLGAIPLGAIPLGAIEVADSPLGAIIIEGSPLGAIPLGAIPLGAIDIVGSPLGAIPLGAIPLGAISFDCTLVDCDSATLGDAVRAGAVLGDPVLGDLQNSLTGIRLSDLIGLIDGVGAAELQSAIDAWGGTMDNLLDLDDLTLADLPTGLQALVDVELGALGDGLDVVTFADVVNAIIDPATGLPIPGIEQALVDAIVALDLLLADLDTIGDVRLGDLFAADGSGPDGETLTLAAIEPILGFITVEAFETVFEVRVQIPDENLADLANAGDLGDLTLADLSKAVLGQAGDFDLADLLGVLGLEAVLDGYTLADLLFALLDPSSRALGGIEFADIDVAELPDGVVPPSSFAVTFTAEGSRSRTVEVSVPIPAGSSYVSGSGGVVAGLGPPAPVEPQRVGDTLVWTVTATPGVTYTVDFDLLAGVSLGTREFTASGRVVGTDVSGVASASVTVGEGLEPINFVNVNDTITASADDVFLTYLSSGTDVDVFEIDVLENQRLVAQLSDLDVDLDLVLWGRSSAATAALGGTSNEGPLFAVLDPDNPESNAAPNEDFPRLDAVDPSLGIIGVSNLSGLQDESLATGRLDAGSYYLQVIGANGATNVLPAALQVKILAADTAPVCQAISFGFPEGAQSVAPTSAELAAADTFILVNEQRIERLYGPDARTLVLDAAQELIDAAAADSSLGISPVLIPVDAYDDVRAAYDRWDTLGGSCDPEAANDVVAEINDIVDPYRENLEHLVILGGDELIPMARLSDETTIANEYDFRNEFTGDLTGADARGQNSFTAPFWQSLIRSDEPYGEAAARSLGNRFLYVSDIALGRVVETPAEIADALQTYVTFRGQLDIETATVLGYDFLSDSSEQIADTLARAETANGPLPVDRELASGGPGDGWTKDDATRKLQEAGTRALVSLNAHFDHYRALPAIGDKDPRFNDNLVAAEAAAVLGPNALQQSLIFSMGCHSGLSVSDILIGSTNAANTNADWAQTLGQQGSLYIGNTGYGYGDTEAVAYTEQLMALFAQQVTSPVDLGGGKSSTVGQALTWAKNQYIAGLQTFSVYDEKAVMESTFYGLPFYRVGSEPAPLPEPPDNNPEPDATGTDAVEQTLQSTNLAPPVSTDLGTYFAEVDEDGNEQIIVAPGQPIQPKDTSDISVVDPVDESRLALDARGAIVLGMESTYQIVDDPVIASPTFVGGASLPERTLSAGVFPTRQVEIAKTTGPAGTRQTLVVATGQYDASTSKQRLDKDIDVVVYYADPGNMDVTPPTIGQVESAVVDGVLAVTLTAGSAADPAEVDRVYVLVAENPGLTEPGTAPTVWRGLDLVRQGSTNRWTGSLLLTPATTSVELTVQAKDRAGNVGFANNKASNFAAPVLPPPPAPPEPPPAQLTVEVEPLTPEFSGWYSDKVTIDVPIAAGDVRYFVNEELQGTLTPPASFDIVDSGIQNWRVTTVDGKSTIGGQVKIDADGPPTVSIGRPAENAEYVTGTRTLNAICTDVSGAECAYQIVGGSELAPGDPLPAAPGIYTLEFSAIDKVGNATSGEVTFRIVAVDAAPILGEITVPTDPQPTGEDVTLTGTFTDRSAPFDEYDVDIDWGIEGAAPGDVIVTAPADASSPGSFTATTQYTNAGVYAVSVTITDSTGESVTTSTSVTVYDPSAAPVITRVEGPTVDVPLGEAVDISVSFDDESVPFDTFTASIDWGAGNGPEPVEGIVDPTIEAVGSFVATQVYTAPGDYEIVVTVTDEGGNGQKAVNGYFVTVVAPEGDPIITGVTGPQTPQPLTGVVEIAATFTDESGLADTYTATVDWGDGSLATPANVTPPDGSTPGTITANRIYDAVGVYTVTVSVTDSASTTATQDFEFVVVFDENERGRVSGSGFYWSGSEARLGQARWGAPAFFGYNARYRGDADRPSGKTQLRLLGDFFFRSTQYDYLIVNDALAVAEGVGTIGSDEYRFRVQGIDEGRLDYFQITIWDPETGVTVYDNGVLYGGDAKGDVVLLGGIRVRDR